MAGSLTSESIDEDAILQIEGVSEVEVWELRDCQAFYISASGRVFASMQSHIVMATGLFPEEKAPQMYLERELRWIRGRRKCHRKNHIVDLFDIHLPIRFNQKKQVKEFINMFPDNLFVRVIGEDQSHIVEDYIRAGRLLDSI